MYFDVVPMLTKGAFAKYFGGKDVFNALPNRSGSFISPLLMGSSLIFLVIFVMFKKYKFRNVEAGRRNTLGYEGELRNIIYSGLTNVYNIIALTFCVAGGLSIVTVHHYFIEKSKNTIEEEDDFDQIPFRNV